MGRLQRLMSGMGIVAALCLLTATGALAGGGIMPPSATPHGWDLSRMTGALALFTTSFNNPAYYPDTPFQILYFDPSTVSFVPGNGGLRIVGSNTFTVPAGTFFFVPLFNADDSPPVLGTWPATHQEAIGYFFGASQLGAQGFEITIDGQSAPVGGAYLAGPVSTPPLFDGGGTHILTLGVFLRPLTPGTHTISIAGGVLGGLVPATGVSFLTEADTYRVTVG